MKTILAAALASCALMSAALAGEMTGTVKEVDMEKHTIVLEDGMSVTTNMDVKLDGVMAGDKVKIMTDDKNMGTMVEKMN
jgi:predicted RNA-binding protein